MSMKKFIISIVVIGVLGLAAWSGAGVYAGFKVEQSLLTFAQQPVGQTPIRISDFKHHRGLMVSHGQFTIHYADPNASGDKRPELVTAVMNYEVDHHVGLSHLATFTWRLVPTGDLEKNINALFAKPFEVSGQGDVKWDGATQSGFAAPELKYAQGTDVLSMGPWKGHLALHGAKFDWLVSSPRFEMKTTDTFLDVKNLSLTVELTDRFTGVGRSVVTIDDMAFPTTQLQGLSFSARNTIANNRISLAFEKTIQTLTFGGQSVSQVDVAFELSDLNQTSIEALSRVLNEAGNFDNLTPDQKQTVQSSLRQLVQEGFKVSIPKLTAQTERGKIVGDALFELTQTDSNQRQFDASKQIKAQGQLSVARSVMPPEYEGLAQMLGLATRTESGLQSQFALLNGQLTVNGRNIVVTQQLNQLNQIVSSFLVP